MFTKDNFTLQQLCKILLKKIVIVNLLYSIGQFLSLACVKVLRSNLWMKGFDWLRWSELNGGKVVGL